MNIQVDMDIQEWNVFRETRRDGNYQMARNGWVGDFNDPTTLLQLLQTGSGNNDGRYSNAKFDEYLSTSMTSSDCSERMGAMHLAETLAIAEESEAPLCSLRRRRLDAKMKSHAVYDDKIMRYNMWKRYSFQKKEQDRPVDAAREKNMVNSDEKISPIKNNYDAVFKDALTVYQDKALDFLGLHELGNLKEPITTEMKEIKVTTEYMDQ